MALTLSKVAKAIRFICFSALDIMGNMCKGHYNYFPYFVLTISKTNWFIMTTDDQYVAKLVDRVVTNTIQLGIKKVVKS